MSQSQKDKLLINENTYLGFPRTLIRKVQYAFYIKRARPSSLKEGISKFCTKNGYSEEVAEFLFNKYSHDLVHANSIDRWCAIFLLTVIGIHDVDLVLDDRGDGSDIGNAVYGKLYESDYDKYLRKPVEDFIHEEVKKLIDSEFLCKTQEQSKASTLNIGDEVPLINNRDVFIQDPNILIRKLRHVFYIKGVTKSSLKAALDAHCVKMHYDEVVARHLLQMYSHNIVHGDWKETSTSLYDTFYANTCRNLCDDDTTYKHFEEVLKTYFHMDDTQVKLVLQDTGDGTMIRKALFGPHVDIPATMLKSLIHELEIGMDAKNIELTRLILNQTHLRNPNEIAEVRKKIATAEQLHKDALSIYAAYAAKKLNL